MTRASRRVWPEGREAAKLGLRMDVSRLSRGELGALLLDTQRRLEAAEGRARSLETALAGEVREHDILCHSLCHDLRTPALTIANFAGILGTDHAAGLDDEARDFIRRIRESAERMDGLLRGVLEYSRVSRQPYALSTVELAQVVAVAVGGLNEVVARTQARVTVITPLPRVRGSRELLVRALTHLVDNALKFTPAGVRPVVEISAAESEDGAVLTVADRGIGIHADFHETVFRLFERLHGATSPYRGNGLGLAVVRRAAERMGGTAAVESAPGAGSRFHLRLPKRPRREFSETACGDGPDPRKGQ